MDLPYLFYARPMKDSRLIDQLMADAWPASETEYLGATRLRWTSGFTRRANSCLAVGSDDEIDGILRAAEVFYRLRDSHPVFLLSEASAPPSMERKLLELGFEATAPTIMQIARSATVAGTGPPKPEWTVEISNEPNDAWFETYWAVESSRERNELHRRICQSLLVRSEGAAYVSVLESQETIAVGQAVVERGWGGVQCMATHPRHRRRGAAAVVLGSLADRAVQLGAENLYLAVMESNVGARELYSRVGFSPVHNYSYFVRK